MAKNQLAHALLVHPRVASWRQTVTVSLGTPTGTDDIGIFVAPYRCKLIMARIVAETSNATLGTVQLITGGAVNLTDALDLDAIGDWGSKEFVIASTNVELAAGTTVYASYTKDTNDPGSLAITLDFERFDTEVPA